MIALFIFFPFLALSVLQFLSRPIRDNEQIFLLSVKNVPPVGVVVKQIGLRNTFIYRPVLYPKERAVIDPPRYQYAWRQMPSSDASPDVGIRQPIP
jgi:hypothetical protein